MAERRLGKGLNSLIPLNDQNTEKVREVPIDKIKPNERQPRQEFNQEKLMELADSVKAHGILQPVLAAIKANGEYALIAGERRLRAAKLAGLKHIPVIIGDFTPQQQMEIALVENLQREDLNPLEEAEAYRRLMEEFAYTQEQLADRVGKSRSAVANVLRLLSLDQRVKDAVKASKLTVGHARTLLAIKDEQKQWQEAEKIINNKFSVRQSEAMIRSSKGMEKKKKEKEADPFLEDVQDRLRSVLGTRVIIRFLSSDKGKVEIDFFSREDLKRLVDLINTNVSRETF